MKPPLQFRINSLPVEAATYPAAMVKAIAHLDTMPIGELLTIHQLAASVGVALDTLKNAAGRIDWQGRRVKHGTRMLYGNSKTIAAYRERFRL